MMIQTCARSSLLIREQIPLRAQESAQLSLTASYLLSNPEIWLHLYGHPHICQDFLLMWIWIWGGEGKGGNGVVGGEEKEERRGRGVNNL